MIGDLFHFLNRDRCNQINIMKKLNNQKQMKRLEKTNDVILDAALQFISDSSPTRFSRNLRKLLLDYISQNKDCLPIDFDVCLNDFNILWNFLDILDDLYRK